MSINRRSFLRRAIAGVVGAVVASRADPIPAKQVGDLYPLKYTHLEGGSWVDWPKGYYLSYKDLKRRGKYTVSLRGVEVHSLLFPVGSGWARWDCVNGWTDTIAKAEKRKGRAYNNKLDDPRLRHQLEHYRRRWGSEDASKK